MPLLGIITAVAKCMACLGGEHGNAECAEQTFIGGMSAARQASKQVGGRWGEEQHGGINRISMRALKESS